MAEKQISCSGRARAVPGSAAGPQRGSEAKGEGTLQKEGETPATATLHGVQRHLCCPHGVTEMIPILQMGNPK